MHNTPLNFQSFFSRKKVNLALRIGYPPFEMKEALSTQRTYLSGWGHVWDQICH